MVGAEEFKAWYNPGIVRDFSSDFKAQKEFHSFCLQVDHWKPYKSNRENYPRKCF